MTDCTLCTARAAHPTSTICGPCATTTTHTWHDLPRLVDLAGQRPVRARTGPRGVPSSRPPMSTAAITARTRARTTHKTWQARTVHDTHRLCATTDQAARDILGAAQQLRVLLDPPPDRTVIGTCECGTALLDTPHVHATTCPTCGTVQTVTDARARLTGQLHDMLGTADEIAAWAGTISASTIRRRAARGLITARGTMPVPGARPAALYRVGDVLT